MKMIKSLGNPNFPTMASLFHSTPSLSFKKRVNWPERSHNRGPPRPTIKLVCKFSQVSPDLIVGKLNDDQQTTWYWRADDDGRRRGNKKQHSNMSSKSYDERSHQDYSKQHYNTSSKSYNERSRDYSRRFENASSNSSSNMRLLPDMTRERLALGLSANGPLNLEDVKTAYRSCAVKWHPDHHQGFSKMFAEEKFKKCNAAYQSLCDKLSSS